MPVLRRSDSRPTRAGHPLGQGWQADDPRRIPAVAGDGPLTSGVANPTFAVPLHVTSFGHVMERNQHRDSGRTLAHVGDNVGDGEPARVPLAVTLVPEEPLGSGVEDVNCGLVDNSEVGHWSSPCPTTMAGAVPARIIPDTQSRIS